MVFHTEHKEFLYLFIHSGYRTRILFITLYFLKINLVHFRVFIFAWILSATVINSQYKETNVMHFSFNLLRIRGLYMFRALLAHPQEALHKRDLVYCLRIMSVGCGTVAVKLCHSQLTLYASNIPNAVCVAPPEDEEVMLETGRGPWFSIKWMKSASRWFHCTDILWCTVSKKLSN
jgi:hypothetical protein